MKKNYLFLALLCALVTTTVFTSCNDDDNDSWQKGSHIDIPKYRAFVLCEGIYGMNDSRLTFVDPAQDTIYQHDVFETQNGMKLGDTANDIICYDGDIYIIMNGSEVLYRLNGSGVLQAQFNDFNADGLGSPRYIAATEGKLYVTCYGGYVARFDAKTLALEAKVKVDANPEEIEIVGTKAYCVCSGWGYGNTICSIEILPSLKESVSIETVPNPAGLKYSDGNMYVLSAGTYNEDWSYATYPCVATYDMTNNTTEKIADASRVCAVDDKLYIVECNHTPHTYSIYNARARNITEWNLTGMPDEFNTQTVYMIEHNPYDGTFYIATTDYVSNSIIYHFNASGQYLGSFSARGINANSMLFLK